jgi:hypothetical protein
MRFLFAASLLVLACSSKPSRPDGQAQDAEGQDTQRDTSVDLPTDASDAATDACANPGTGFCGFPRCTFVDPPATGSAQCNLTDCTNGVDAGADANSFGCATCPDGYSCAVYCPSPLGGCGPPAMCCRAQ